MNYATWQLNFDDSNYGTGPEDALGELGFSAEGAWLLGSVETQGTILGYVTAPVLELELLAWNVKNISQKEALDFCLQINPNAYLLPDGKIANPRAENQE